MSKVKYTEITHQWEGTAIVRTEEGLKEIPLGVVESQKRLTDVGAKELFIVDEETSKGLIAVEVKKLVDVKATYEMESEEFKKVAKLSDTPSEQHEE